MIRANQSTRQSCFTQHLRHQWSAKEKLMVIHYLKQSKSVHDQQYENDFELIDLTNEDQVWVETEDIDNIYSETMVDNDWVLIS
ncbi:6360_t:CDS:2 [Cetraspora pellucida]|uniref:6360_t:CDS:1 n=1 Tax=Cetraspora pellucida TaxID=1433469 RepID=A0ACA9JW44_9GLOM|nr:6360_t:CDS:2 [Cetraspora pellucida]